MNAHWSENDSVELLQISINNYPKFVHLKKNNDPDKFYDDRVFSKYHNLGRNGKSIKNRIETVQKKFRKTVRGMDINKFKDGIIEGECYKTPESRELFNTSFEFERLFGKYCGSKELMRIIEVVCRSDYWTNNRKRIHPRWNRRSLHDSDDDIRILTKSIPACVQNPIVISSAESSGSDDLSSFKDVDFVVNRKRKISKDCNLSNALLRDRSVDDSQYNSSLPKCRLVEGSLSTDLDNEYISITPDKCNVLTQTDGTIIEPIMKSFGIMTDAVSTSSKDCATDNVNISHKDCATQNVKKLSLSEMTSTNILPLEDFDDISDVNSLGKAIMTTFGPMVTSVSGLHNTLNDISESLRQMVQIMSSYK